MGSVMQKLQLIYSSWKATEQYLSNEDIGLVSNSIADVWVFKEMYI